MTNEDSLISKQSQDDKVSNKIGHRDSRRAALRILQPGGLLIGFLGPALIIAWVMFISWLVN